MPTLALNVSGIVGSGPPPVTITSGAADPLTLEIIDATSIKGSGYAPNWVETARPGKRPLMHIRDFPRPERSMRALLWWPDNRTVEGVFNHLYRHCQGAYGITFGFGAHMSAHRWAVTDLEQEVQDASEVDNSTTKMVVTFTLKELTSEYAWTSGPLPGLPVSWVVTGTAPVPSQGRTGPRRWVWRDGDTLQRVAQQVYGSQSFWRTIAAANDLADPRPARIATGQLLVLP